MSQSKLIEYDQWMVGTFYQQLSALLCVACAIPEYLRFGGKIEAHLKQHFKKP